MFVAFLTIFLSHRLVVVTQAGEIRWFVLDGSAEVIEDGTQVEGWMHRDRKGWAFIITRNDRPAGRESYLVIPYGRRGPIVEGCDGWTAARMPVLPFPVFVFDALPCPGWRLPEHPTLYGRAVVSSNSLEFADEKGRRLQVRWK